MERFYRLRVGSNKINGFLLRVDDSSQVPKLEDFAESGLGFRLIRGSGNEFVYEAKRDDFLAKDVPIQIRISGQGDLEASTQTKPVYIEEVNKKQAERLRQEADAWKMQAGYIGDNF